jgi:hypothetical protein
MQPEAEDQEPSLQSAEQHNDMENYDEDEDPDNSNSCEVDLNKVLEY